MRALKPSFVRQPSRKARAASPNPRNAIELVAIAGSGMGFGGPILGAFVNLGANLGSESRVRAPGAGEGRGRRAFHSEAAQVRALAGRAVSANIEAGRGAMGSPPVQRGEAKTRRTPMRRRK